MSLHGTLETFALPDVLALLAATKKTGELRVVGGKTDGRVWFDAGAVVGVEVGRATGYVDAVFELLRLESGKFSFDAEKPAPAPGEPGVIETLLAEAQARLAEWRSIEEVIPSVDCGVSLSSEVTDPHVMVTGQQWRALVGVASAGTVSSLIDHLDAGEFETCRTLKGLVEAGLVRVGEAPAAATAPATAPAPVAVLGEAPAPEPEPEPQVVAEPEAAMPVSELAAPEPASEPVEAHVDAPVEEPVVTAEPAPEPVDAAVAEPAPLPVEAVLAAPDPEPARAKIQALTSTPAASAAALEDELRPELRREPVPTPPTRGEADELVRQVAALESATVEPGRATEPPPLSPEPVVEAPTPEAPVAEAPVAEAPVAAAPVPEAPPAATGPAEGEEPINRGLLLKFLSSVRT